MLVSWNWLREYVQPAASPEEVGQRLMASGLNLESVERVGDDTVLDLEVTSNRPDCLGHLGVAREVATLYNCPITLPTADFPTVGESASRKIQVTISDPVACPRYLARVIRGVTIGPSPQWLVDRLAAIGQKSVNNVVDVTNYVLFELAQPFHTFDLNSIRGGRIEVRRARAGETMAALNQKSNQETYKLDPSMLVIADGERPVAIAGIMGGLETGISESTTDLLLETADFSALAIRGTARSLSLFSPSQYRFERGVDRRMIDWASRRCAALIVAVAGGEVLDGVVDAYPANDTEPTIVTLRFDQIERLLGVPVAAQQAVEILGNLGIEKVQVTEKVGQFRPPSWRRDLSREVDLIEEVARIIGYDAIPDDADVPLSLSRKSELDRVRERMRQVLTSHGFDEALTLSFVSREELDLFDPLPEQAPLVVEHSSRRHENHLRKSLIPSLLNCRRENERKGNFDADLFEIAKVYLEAAPGRPEAEVEPLRIGFVSGRSFGEVKGIVEQLLSAANPALAIEARPSELASFAEGRGAELWVAEERWGWIGEISPSVQQSRSLELRDAVVVAELDFSLLQRNARRVPTHRPISIFPAIERDLNFVLDEEVSWAELSRIASETAGAELDRAEFLSQFRGKQLGADKKSYVIRLVFRSAERTLTSEEVDQSVGRIVKACEQSVGAMLRV